MPIGPAAQCKETVRWRTRVRPLSWIPMRTWDLEEQRPPSTKEAVVVLAREGQFAIVGLNVSSPVGARSTERLVPGGYSPAMTCFASGSSR